MSGAPSPQPRPEDADDAPPAGGPSGEPAAADELPPAAPPPNEAPDPSAAKRWTDRRRLARWVALAGALVVVLAGKSLILPLVPESREIEVRVDSPSDLVALDMRWAPAEGGEDIATTSLHFSAGAAPSTVRATVHLPDGTYDVDIVAARSSRVDSTRRRIELSGSSHVTIPLR